MRRSAMTQWLVGVGVSFAVVVGGVLAAERATPDPPNEVTLLGPTTTLAPPVRRQDDRPAEATVDAAYTWGLTEPEVYLRARPDPASAIVGEVAHGDRLEVRCWTIGPEVSNGMTDRTYDDLTEYVSDLWWSAAGPGREGYVSDVWLGRTNGDTLSTERCD